MTYTSPAESLNDSDSGQHLDNVPANSLLNDAGKNSAVLNELMGNQQGVHIEDGQIRVPPIETVIAQNTPDNPYNYIEPPTVTGTVAPPPETTPRVPQPEPIHVAPATEHAEADYIEPPPAATPQAELSTSD
jgi:hypothetical protein